MADRQDQLDARTIVALSLWAMVGSVSLVLAGRATSGAFDRPVMLAIPVFATLVVTSASLVAWTLFHREGSRGDVGRRTLDGLLAMVPAALAGFSTAQNAAPLTLAVVSMLLICGLAFVAAREGIRPAGVGLSSQATGPGESLVTPAGLAETSSEPDVDSAAVNAEKEDEAPRQQQLTRRTLPDGGVEIEAALLARFEIGQRQTAVHLPIHPAFHAVPHVECEPLEDASVTVRPTTVHGYGVRIEVKRTEAVDTSTEVPIGVLITSAERHESAA